MKRKEYMYKIYQFSACTLFHILCSKLESVGYYLCGKQYQGPIHSSRSTDGIPDGSVSTKIRECLSVNLRTFSCSYWWKPNTQFTSSSSGWPLVMVTLFIFPHGLRFNTVVYMCLEEVMQAGSRGWLLEDPTFANRTLWHATQTREPSDYITPKIWPPN